MEQSEDRNVEKSLLNKEEGLLKTIKAHCLCKEQIESPSLHWNPDTFKYFSSKHLSKLTLPHCDSYTLPNHSSLQIPARKYGTVTLTATGDQELRKKISGFSKVAGKAKTVTLDLKNVSAKNLAKVIHAAAR